MYPTKGAETINDFPLKLILHSYCTKSRLLITLFLSCQISLKFWPEHDNINRRAVDITVLCAKFRKDFTTKINIIEKRGLASSLQWRRNGYDGVSNHQPHDCLLNHLFGRRSNKTSQLRVTGLCEGNSPVTGEFPAQRASNAEIVSIWWRHRV